MSFFFFSSRRRHTRYIGDWSSDVCSSDLLAVAEQVVGRAQPRSEVVRPVRQVFLLGEKPRRGEPPGAHRRGGRRCIERSEERRVGKECKLRRAPEQSKNR